MGFYEKLKMSYLKNKQSCKYVAADAMVKNDMANIIFRFPISLNQFYGYMVILNDLNDSKKRLAE
jgi:hypothetical protein